MIRRQHWQPVRTRINRLRRFFGPLLIDRPAVERQQLIMLARQTQLDAAGALFFSLVLAICVDSPVALFDAPDIGPVWLWFAVFPVWAPIMIFTGRRLLRADRRTFNPRPWRWGLTLLYLINGMIWVRFMLVAWSETNVALQAVVMIVVLAHLATYLVNLGPHMLVFVLPVVAVVTSSELIMLHHDTDLANFAAISYPLFGLYQLLLGRDAHRRLSASLMRTTELREVTEDLESARARAVEDGEARDQFFASMSHELRTPLNAVIGFSDLMAQQVHGPLGNESYRGYVGDISDSGRHLLRLVDDLLDMSSAEQKKLTVVPEMNSIDDLLGEVKQVLVPLADRKGIRLIVPPPSGRNACFDQLRLKQVLINLGSNAIKFTNADGEVRIDWSVDPDDTLVLSVRDNGVGIAEEDMKLIFDPFRQAETARVARKVDHGTGLGLTIARELAEQHGGTLQLESRLGAGTLAIVRLTNARVSEPGQDSPGPETPTEIRYGT